MMQAGSTCCTDHRTYHRPLRLEKGSRRSLGTNTRWCTHPGGEQRGQLSLQKLTGILQGRCSLRLLEGLRCRRCRSSIERLRCHAVGLGSDGRPHISSCSRED